MTTAAQDPQTRDEEIHDPGVGPQTRKIGKNTIVRCSCFFFNFVVENGISGAWEGLKKLRGGVALRCDRVSCRGEPWGPDS